MKADFEMHQGTVLLYPTRKDVWRKGALPIAKTVNKLAACISEFEPVFLGVLPEIDKTHIKNECGSAKIVSMLYNDIWVRDSGAVPCKDRLVKFGFNAWGGDDGLYDDWSYDITVPEQMRDLLDIPLDKSPITLEGGNLLCDGRGTLICIKNALCNNNRNPQFDKKTIEDYLKRDLDIQNIIWIDEGLAFDETGGHIDNLCAFADEKTVLLAWTDDISSPQYSIVRTAYKKLKDSCNAQGESYKIVKIPLPRCFERSEDDCVDLVLEEGSKERYLGEPIQPTYINFAFVNGGIILPAFDDPADEEARKIFENVFPDRKIVSFPAREILLGGGGIHCITKNY